jgi:hypothetical protein
MKTIAKLTIFFSLIFVMFFLTAILLGSISSWINLARVISEEPRAGSSLAESAWMAVSTALYFAILFSLNYSAMRKIHVPLAFICISTLALIFVTGISLGANRMENLGSVFLPVSQVQAEPGLMLSRGDNVIVLLKESSEIRGPRLVSIPGQPFIYQEIPLGPNNTILSLPDLPLGAATHWLIRSVEIDFSLSAGMLKTLFNENFLFFLAYALALIMLLSSLRFILELSHWPLANIFIGALVFRLILSLEIFINSREINVLISSFLAERVHSSLITPLIFAGLSILILLYTLLTGIARSGGLRSKRNWDD